MCREFYNENEEKYKVLPKLILPGLACTSYTKGTNLWHRAKVLKLVDEENVQVIRDFKYLHIILFKFSEKKNCLWIIYYYIFIHES